MKAKIGHVGINLSNMDNLRFWKELLQYLEFSIAGEGEHFDAASENSYLCISVTEQKYRNDGFHRKRTGLNHIALRVETADQVNVFVSEFLELKGITPLYGGAKPYPEYVPGYYAVFFEDLNRIKIEVVYEP
jgi:catechol 2,3-dioxygenase-like lactoylglutathione lyase family enzyme